MEMCNLRLNSKICLEGENSDRSVHVYGRTVWPAMLRISSDSDKH